jgi:hypothetical protein
MGADVLLVPGQPVEGEAKPAALQMNPDRKAGIGELVAQDRPVAAVALLFLGRHHEVAERIAENDDVQRTGRYSVHRLNQSRISSRIADAVNR